MPPRAYPPALQLALDMFKRLNVDPEYILEIFLSKLDILRALRFLSANQILDSVSARKYLEYSLKSNDLILFYSVFKCFQERNQKLRGSYQFAKGEDLIWPSSSKLSLKLSLTFPSFLFR